jgi:TatA/E family protein of Tat protein translocase
MFGFGHILELVIVLVIALLFLGPKRIPELASGLGKGIREFRRTRSEDAEGLTDGRPAELPAPWHDAPALSSPACRHDSITYHPLQPASTNLNMPHDEMDQM